MKINHFKLSHDQEGSHLCNPSGPDHPVFMDFPREGWEFDPVGKEVS